jgi:predicted GIY-YIG superfamily endonuclease
MLLLRSLPFFISTEGKNLMNAKSVYYVYLLTNKNNKGMYIGVTNNLEQRIYEHRAKRVPGFTEKYNVNKQVYFEVTGDISLRD